MSTIVDKTRHFSFADDMNVSIHGHASISVYMYTSDDGKFLKWTLPFGTLLLAHDLFQRSQVENTDYRHNYYICHCVDGKSFFIHKELGYENSRLGTDIYKMEPENINNPIDLIIWDEGYGGLEIKDKGNYRQVLWASNKKLPDKEQFIKIASQCTLLIDADVIRNAGIMISTQVSWERTTYDLVTRLRENSKISYLMQAKHLIIPFAEDGAVYIDNTNKEWKANITLTNGDTERTLRNKNDGSIETPFIHMTSLLAKLHIDSACTAPIEDIIKFMLKSIGATVNSGFRLNWKGKEQEEIAGGSKSIPHGQSSTFSIPEDIDENWIIINEENMRDSLYDNWKEKEQEEIAGGSKSAPHGQSSTFSIPEDIDENWIIINEENMRNSLYDRAFEYVQKGAKVIEGLPQLRLGNLVTIDRWEIEAYQNIRKLILSYANGESTRPLSIAVFGSPGSGKSFGVTEIAKNIMPGKIEKLEFNVSQFTSLNDLGIAFQKVRDTILGGKLPLVFFDEFDSDKDGLPLGWVKSFLMPMQDGKFRDDSGEHPLGRCILVFAGGTAASFEEFANPMNNFSSFLQPLDHGTSINDVYRQAKKAKKEKEELTLPMQYAISKKEENNTDQQKAVDEINKARLSHDEKVLKFKNIKGPDFVSRLRGTINVLGPNPKNEDDKNYILRRALLLRSLCERKKELEYNNELEKFKADTAPVSPNIIRAMLHVPEYKHGVRSMEAILDMSNITDNYWNPSDLPSPSQLSLHVDADAFMNLIRNSKFSWSENWTN